MNTPQESRERFFEEVRKAVGGDYTFRDKMLFIDEAFTSLITHAMQQIEAGKGESALRVNTFKEGHKDGVNVGLQLALAILQSLLPEQNIKK